MSFEWSVQCDNPLFKRLVEESTNFQRTKRQDSLSIQSGVLYGDSSYVFQVTGTMTSYTPVRATAQLTVHAKWTPLQVFIADGKKYCVALNVHDVIRLNEDIIV